MLSRLTWVCGDACGEAVVGTTSSGSGGTERGLGQWTVWVPIRVHNVRI